MKETIFKTSRLIEAIKDPEYRFLLLEPILFYGIALGLILFVIAFFIKNGKIQTAGLIVTGASAFAYLPYMAARRMALPRIEQIYRFAQNSRSRIFSENTALWNSSMWLYVTVICLAVATIMVGSRRNQLGYSLSIATVVLGLFAIQNSLWLHYQDASSVHPNLKAHRAPIEATVKNNATASRIPEGIHHGNRGRDADRKTRYVRPIE